MTIQTTALQAYGNALRNFAQAEKKIQSGGLSPEKASANNFADVLAHSLEKVNSLQAERSVMTDAFASGQSQNVHELMITMQKAGLAMNMTAAVRNKIMEAYKELTRLQF
ncbi:MAG: flagellar hook-basal body complex protein FliE [Desulfovibrio sp.]|jgi:flagellar hook-basal body complex protein FliE|nr:flagellar hook-basal body complex protein FliE [Desulfovibrio sp.]